MKKKIETKISPAGYEEVDQNLLDYDSDSGEQEEHRHQATDNNKALVTNKHQTSNTSSVEMETEGAVQATSDMDAVYYQCNSTCNACRKDTLTSVSSDNSYGKTVTVQSPPIGSFADHEGIDKTFHGSRVMKGNVTANESISCSFQPATLTCLSCNTEHSIVNNNPIMVLFSDQNFPASLSSNNCRCINIVRLENATLFELLDIAKEIFGNTTIADGSTVFSCLGQPRFSVIPELQCTPKTGPKLPQSPSITGGEFGFAR